MQTGAHVDSPVVQASRDPSVEEPISFVAGTSSTVTVTKAPFDLAPDYSPSAGWQAFSGEMNAPIIGGVGDILVMRHTLASGSPVGAAFTLLRSNGTQTDFALQNEPTFGTARWTAAHDTSNLYLSVIDLDHAIPRLLVYVIPLINPMAVPTPIVIDVDSTPWLQNVLLLTAGWTDTAQAGSMIYWDGKYQFVAAYDPNIGSGKVLMLDSGGNVTIDKVWNGLDDYHSANLVNVPYMLLISPGTANNSFLLLPMPDYGTIGVTTAFIAVADATTGIESTRRLFYTDNPDITAFVQGAYVDSLNTYGETCHASDVGFFIGGYPYQLLFINHDGDSYSWRQPVANTANAFAVALIDQIPSATQQFTGAYDGNDYFFVATSTNAKGSGVLSTLPPAQSIFKLIQLTPGNGLMPGQFTLYDNALVSLADGQINLASDTIVAALVTSTSSSDAVWSDISAAELASGGGYTAGGVVLTGQSVTTSNTGVIFTADPITWTTFTAGPFRYLVLVHRAGTNLAPSDVLLCWCDMAGGVATTVTGTGKDFVVTPDIGGILRFTHS
jgi:hypothetical protein